MHCIYDRFVSGILYINKRKGFQSGGMLGAVRVLIIYQKSRTTKLTQIVKCLLSSTAQLMQYGNIISQSLALRGGGWQLVDPQQGLD